MRSAIMLAATAAILVGPAGTADAGSPACGGGLIVEAWRW